MAVTVLIVDDSGFFRRRITELIEKDGRLKLVGTATNGREAVRMCTDLKPDVVSMDVEMPDMNGIEAVKLIMRDCPTAILMLSSLTRQGAQTTLKAIEAGASDFLMKDIRSWTVSSNNNEFIERLVRLGRNPAIHPQKAKERLAAQVNLGSNKPSPGASRAAPPPVPSRSAPPVRGPMSSNVAQQPIQRPTQSSTVSRSGQTHSQVAAVSPAARAGGSKAAFPSQCRLVVIGSSTGGPAALQQILTALPANYPYPILLVQHMPKAFTSVFAARLNQQCAVNVKEAEDGDMLRPGMVLLAPGGHQMMVDPHRGDRVRILESDERVTYRPSVDITYASAAKALGNKVHAIILTGMGADGADGARMLKRAGATMWAQNKESCTIYGMPQAVVNAGLADEIMNLESIAENLARAARR
jgi:two-component system chemotaxis response regulator CheB